MLTYNEHNIRSEIILAQGNGCLLAAEASAPWEAKPRCFLMCQPLVDSIKQGEDDSNEKTRTKWARVVADIGFFVEGGYINEDLMKQLVPEKYEHWALRSRRPKPSIRVFGRFMLPNIFIGTHAKPRKLLGGMWSDEFEHEKLVVEELLEKAGITKNTGFTDNPAFRYEKYITENASRKVKV